MRLGFFCICVIGIAARSLAATETHPDQRLRAGQAYAAGDFPLAVRRRRRRGEAASLNERWTPRTPRTDNRAPVRRVPAIGRTSEVPG